MRQRLFATGWGLLALAAAGLCAAPATRAADVTQLDPNDPLTWLVKSACTDGSNLVLPVDPYGGCPAGAGIRKIQSGDPLPYHNIEQGGYQQRDAFPVFNPIDGNTWIIANYDYQPFDLFNLYNGTDGYDVYALQGGLFAGGSVNIVNTSDGGGYGQTFYGSNCSEGDAWLSFPRQGFLSGGQATVPIKGIYWEQTGQSYPGGCPTSYSTNTQTSWQLHSGFQFGGVNGNPTKTMDTLVSYHGFKATLGFLTGGHLEVFYFTREYGITRWEVWTPTVQGPTATTECNVPATETYQGVDFVVQDCHDWSNLTPAATPQIPVWPIPNINLLANAHFGSGVQSGWGTLGRLIRSTAISTAARDTANGTGVAYLRASCDNSRCNGFSEALYQDVPARSLVSGTYGFGVSARTEAVQGAGTSGWIGVSVRQLDGRGKVLWSDSTMATVTTDNGNAPSPGEAESVYLSTSFVNKTTRITLFPQTAKIRFLISPLTPQTFDVLDAWFAPWPLPSAGFGSLP